jgi:DNA-directed RNA polymerase subunit M/transcription elongation factor TFIIS
VAVRVPCPACRAALLVSNPHYLVVVNCHACGHEFLADGENLTEVPEAPEAAQPVEYWIDDEAQVQEARPKAHKEAAVLRFCPMCGELAPESVPECPACGELLPDDQGRKGERDPSAKNARRFRRQAQLLGVLWILLAYLILEQDFWLGGRRLDLPEVISGASVTVPPIPLMGTVLVSLAVFALAGQFWAVAVGGLLNYLVLFLMVWQANVISLALLAALIVLAHITLHQAASVRFRE